MNLGHYEQPGGQAVFKVLIFLIISMLLKSLWLLRDTSISQGGLSSIARKFQHSACTIVYFNMSIGFLSL